MLPKSLVRGLSSPSRVIAVSNTTKLRQHSTPASRHVDIDGSFSIEAIQIYPSSPNDPEALPNTKSPYSSLTHVPNSIHHQCSNFLLALERTLVVALGVVLARLATARDLAASGGEPAGP